MKLQFNEGDMVLVATDGDPEALVSVHSFLEPDPVYGINRFVGVVYPRSPGFIKRKVFFTDSVVKVYSKGNGATPPDSGYAREGLA